MYTRAQELPHLLRVRRFTHLFFVKRFLCLFTGSTHIVLGLRLTLLSLKHTRKRVRGLTGTLPGTHTYEGYWQPYHY